MLTINPSILVRQMKSGSTQVEINGQVLLLDEMLMIGASYRTGEKALVAMFGLNIKDTFKLYYSYDVAFNDISNYSSGSNELTLGFRLNRKKSRPIYIMNNHIFLNHTAHFLIKMKTASL